MLLVGLGEDERFADPQARQSTTISPRNRRP
jgi:hypothetical protein